MAHNPTPAPAGVERSPEIVEAPDGAKFVRGLFLLGLAVVAIAVLFNGLAARNQAAKQVADYATHLALKEVTVRLVDGSAAREGPAPFAVLVRPAYQVKDPAGAPWVYRWDFGDGSSSDLERPLVHTYKQGGTYAISLTVHSVDKGWSATASTQVVVTGGVADGPQPDKNTLLEGFRRLPGVLEPLKLPKLGGGTSESEKSAVPDGELIRLKPGEFWTSKEPMKVGDISPWFTCVETPRGTSWHAVAEGPGVQKFEGWDRDYRYRRFRYLSGESGKITVRFVQSKDK